MVNVGNLRVDFYLPEYNLAIEFEGEQHYSHQEYFGTKEQYERMLENDAIKKEYCIANGINYLEIPYVYRGQEGKIIQEYIDKIIETKIKEEPKKAKPTKIVYIPSGTQLEHIHLIEEEPKNERLTPEQIEIREQELELKMAYIELQKQKQGMV